MFQHGLYGMCCFNDDQLFESGAILAYLADAYGGLDTPQKRATVMPWLVWANSSLDPCVFIETPEGRVVDTGARGKPGKVWRTFSFVVSDI